jgi:hypothetical protein
MYIWGGGCYSLVAIVLGYSDKVPATTGKMRVQGGAYLEPISDCMQKGGGEGEAIGEKIKPSQMCVGFYL